MSRLFAAAVLAAVAAGCGSSTSLTNMWKDPNYAGPPMSKILVLSMHRDEALRRNWEDGIAAELRERGVEAVPSYELDPAAHPDSQRIVETVRSRGFDGLIITHMLSREVESRYVPGYVRTVPALGYDPWYGVYYNYYRRIYEPGYVERDEIVRYQTDVFTTRDAGKLVWTGTTESIDPKSSIAVSEEITKKIVPELASQGILAARG